MSDANAGWPLNSTDGRQGLVPESVEERRMGVAAKEEKYRERYIVLVPRFKCSD